MKHIIQNGQKLGKVKNSWTSILDTAVYTNYVIFKNIFIVAMMLG